MEHAGRLYVHGFFVSQADNLPLHGLNYCGSLTSLLGVGFGRDRNMVSASALAMHVPQVRLAGEHTQLAVDSVACGAGGVEWPVMCIVQRMAGLVAQCKAGLLAR